jgi:hypothetical protein
MRSVAEQGQEGCFYDRIKAIRMSESDRQLAMGCLRNAERLYGLFDRIAGLFETIRIALMTPLRRWLSVSR